MLTHTEMKMLQGINIHDGKVLMIFWMLLLKSLIWYIDPRWDDLNAAKTSPQKLKTVYHIAVSFPLRLKHQLHSLTRWWIVCPSSASTQCMSAMEGLKWWWKWTQLCVQEDLKQVRKTIRNHDKNKEQRRQQQYKTNNEKQQNNGNNGNNHNSRWRGTTMYIAWCSRVDRNNLL